MELSTPLRSIVAIIIVACTLGACRESSDANNGGQSDDPNKLACVVATDFFMVHFTAYQEPTADDRNDRKKAFSPYCQDLPRVGKSYLTIDMLDADVKSTPIRARVLAKAEGGKPEREVVALPAKVYATGIVELVADLPKAGEYLVELGIGRTVAEEDTIRIPIRVAMRPPLSERWRPIALAFLGLGVVGSVLVMAMRFWRGRRAQAQA